jgi:hypothetical protein
MTLLINYCSTMREGIGNRSLYSNYIEGTGYTGYKLHSERGFFGMLPTMAAPLGEVCGVPRELL